MARFLGLISDTHGHPTYTAEALRMLLPFEPVAILHAGDIGGAEIIHLFPQAIPCHFVQGNCDYGLQELAAAVGTAGHTWWGEFGDLQVEQARVALLHGDDHHRLTEAINGGQFDLVVHGHTHVAKRERVGRTWVLNPGAMYRANPHSVAVVDLATLITEILPVHSAV